VIQHNSFLALALYGCVVTFKPSENSSWCTLSRRLGGTWSWPGHFGEMKHLLALPGMKSQFLACLACSLKLPVYYIGKGNLVSSSTKIHFFIVLWPLSHASKRSYLLGLKLCAWTWVTFCTWNINWVHTSDVTAIYKAIILACYWPFGIETSTTNYPFIFSIFCCQTDFLVQSRWKAWV
jgi:hypothetical protein